MSLFKNGLRVLNCIVTLGGSEELLIAQEEYEKNYAIYKQDYDLACEIKSHIDQSLITIGKAVASVKKPLNFSKAILSQNISYNEQVSNRTTALVRLNNFKASYNSAMTTGFGGQGKSVIRSSVLEKAASAFSGRKIRL